MEILKKNYALIAAGALGLIAYLFLPLVSIEMFGQSISLSIFDSLTGNGDFGFLDILPILGGILIIVAAIRYQKKLALGCSIVSVLALLAQLGNAAEEFAEVSEMTGMKIGATDVLGAGYWISLVVFAVAIFFSVKLGNGQQEQ